MLAISLDWPLPRLRSCVLMLPGWQSILYVIKRRHLIAEVFLKILITGNMGYVGPEVTKYLRAKRPGAMLHGYDNAYFAHCLTGTPVLPERHLDQQFYGDLRRVDVDLKGYDAVVQLAAISNDPMGNRFEAVTMDINQNTTISLARAAVDAGVKNFVFASSCSVYGIADG